MATEIPPAQKTRTITHMNKDHGPDMRHILHHLSPTTVLPPGASDPVMLDIDLSAMTLHLPDSDTTTTIPFTPPLQSWDERRTRLVEMTRTAKEALGIPDEADSSHEGGGTAKVKSVVVKEYMAPRWPYDAAIFLAVLFYYFQFTLVKLGFFESGSLLATVVESVGFPGGVAGFRWLTETIFVPVLGIHVAETWWLERTRLRAFGVERGSRVWWLWVGSVFVEGAMAFKRFDLVVERLRGEVKGGKGE